MADLNWTIPVMRAGYAGRGVTYLAMAGLSLFAIWRGGDAKGTSSTMDTLATSWWGILALWLIAFGLGAYAVWRLTAATEDLEDYGTDAKGLVSRVGMGVTGVVHGGMAGLAVAAALGLEGSGGGIPGYVSMTLGWPGGWILIGIAGVCTAGAGIYELYKAWTASHRDHLCANPFTRHWDWAIRAGIAAQGILISIIGLFLMLAAWTGRSGETGGVERAFDFLEKQPFGNAIVAGMCFCLIGFAFYCGANALYRIIPKVSGDGLDTLRAKVDAVG